MAKQTFTTGQVLTAAQMTSLQQTAMGGGSTTAKTASYVLVAADAGTVVQMNSASATTITVNTALFAAGDTVQIQNVGAGVCTVTAGTATVSTSSTLALKQYDAGSLYFNTTSAAIFFAADAADGGSPLTTKGDLFGFSTLDARIPIGANNTILTADSAQALGLKWATPAAPTFAGCDLRKTANQTISNNSVTKITFDSENFDTNGFHDNATNNTRITIPTGYAGKYLFLFIASWENNSTGQRNTIFYVNGSEAENISRLNNSGAIMVSNSSLILNLSAADYVEFACYQNSGGTISINAGTASQNLASTRFSCTYLGA